MQALFVEPLVKIALLLFALMTAAAYLVLLGDTVRSTATQCDGRQKRVDFVNGYEAIVQYRVQARVRRIVVTADDQ